MARSLFNAPLQIQAGTITRALHNTTTAGSAVLNKVIAGTGVTLVSTGADAGTGDVTINAPSYQAVTKTAAYTEIATTGQVIAICNLTAGFTVTLPTAVGNAGKFIYKKALAAGQIIIAGASAQTIDGGATATLNNQYESITIVSDNANWAII